MMNREDLTERDSDRTDTSDLPGKARAYLIVRQGDRCEVVEIPERGEAIIGRGSDVSVVIDESCVSPRHASVSWRSGELVVEDLGSRNGTALNHEVLHGELRSARGGDSIRIAGHEIMVAVQATPPNPDPTPDAEDGVVVADAS